MTITSNKNLPSRNNGREIFYIELQKEYGEVLFEFKFHPSRKFKHDIFLHSKRIAIEIEGGIHTRYGGHSTGTGIMRDIEKYNLSLTCGNIVYRIPAHELSKPDDILGHLRNIREVAKFR